MTVCLARYHSRTCIFSYPSLSIFPTCLNNCQLRSNFSRVLLSQIKDGFGEGKDLVVSVMSAMGEEQICALKDIGPKN